MVSYLTIVDEIKKHVNFHMEWTVVLENLSKNPKPELTQDVPEPTVFLIMKIPMSVTNSISVIR